MNEYQVSVYISHNNIAVSSASVKPFQKAEILHANGVTYCLNTNVKTKMFMHYFVVCNKYCI